MGKLQYKTNWNGKLHCKFHTSFRIHNPKKYYPGAILIEELNGRPINRVKVVKVFPRQLNDVTELEAYHDTGYGLAAFRKIVNTMYKNKVHVPTQSFDLVLLEILDNQQTLM